MSEEIWCRRPPRQEELPAKARQYDLRVVLLKRRVNASPDIPIYDACYTRLGRPVVDAFCWYTDCEWLREDE
ncbi:MAG: hypothetical protein A2139_02935 [Desulfobacca sp. RBG_16_60_12]|nr:MAG: hypothetical protein A2139_02935 [Desulfobacca sp. RBG_16_60_12]